METYYSTTPFGRRTLTLAHVASQVAAKERPPEKAVHKWRIYQAICDARTRLGVSERALAVLNALLTFHPETVLTGEDLIVFPSNAHGAGDAPASSGRPGRCRHRDPAGQPERQALRAARGGG